ncbi:MAG: hypothetical protein WCF57_23650 [Pyrinomonadaceae bacterium]
MFDLNATLDNMIAMVIVLLALSLVVQAVQSSIKKAFKLKSRQIEDSLAHLFKYILDQKEAIREATETKYLMGGPKPGEKAAPQPPGASVLPQTSLTSTNTPSARWNGVLGIIDQSPFLRVFFRRAHPATQGDAKCAALYDEVMAGFRAMGRTALSTRPIFDSLSKDDLLSVIGSIAPEKIDSAFGEKIGSVVTHFKELEAQFRAWETALSGFDPKTTAGYLSDEDRTKLAEMQAKIKPLLDDLRLLLSGTTNTQAGLETLARDLAKLRSINLDDTQKVLTDVRGRVSQALESARVNKNTDAVNALTVLDTALKSLTETIARFRQKFAAVFANWLKLEHYFDTVMQSFEERYTRSMKTSAIIISFLVVVFLNANFFRVYQDISTSDAKRSLILQSRDDVLKAINRNNTPPATDAGAAQKQADQTALTVKSWFDESKKEIDKNTALFTGYGFTPLTLADTGKWLSTLSPGAEGWVTYRKRDAKVLLGWIVMALLLSVGAPFWQDFLESLFGVKNVLRKKSETQNVEQKPGAGQTKQS